MTENEAWGQAFENGRKVGDAEGYARGRKEAFTEAGDLISRKGLIDAIVNTPSKVTECHGGDVLTALADRQNEVLNLVEKAPAIDAEPVKRELIDRGKLLRDPYFQEDRYPESHLLRMAIREQPTVDAVEVVRCKDCRFCKKHPTSDKAKICTNDRWNTEYHPFAHDEGFCSYGERRTDNEKS